MGVGQQVKLTTFDRYRLRVTITKVLTKSNGKPGYKVRYNHNGIEAAGIYDSSQINVVTKRCTSDKLIALCQKTLKTPAKKERVPKTPAKKEQVPKTPAKKEQDRFDRIYSEEPRP